MPSPWNDLIWRQLGASLDMLENAIRACPLPLWGDRERFPEFWYIAYHTLFFTDYYLSTSDQGFAPPSPFTLSEFDPSGVMPERVYSKDELLAYLEHSRAKAKARLLALTDDEAFGDSGFARREMSVLELAIYNTRHVQHHTAQLNLLLRQVTDSAPPWVSKAGSPLSGR